jgi:hypothetical protein
VTRREEFLSKVYPREPSIRRTEWSLCGQWRFVGKYIIVWCWQRFARREVARLQMLLIEVIIV